MSAARKPRKTVVGVPPELVEGHPDASTFRRLPRAMVYEDVPEDRWFWRVVLRRRTRRSVLLIGLVKDGELRRQSNAPFEAHIVVTDPMSLLAEVETDA